MRLIRALRPHVTRQQHQHQQELGFPAVMMSGSGTSIFAMGPAPPTGFDPNAFAKEMDVSVWATHFTGRPEGDSKAWYPPPRPDA